MFGYHGLQVAYSKLPKDIATRSILLMDPVIGPNPNPNPNLNSNRRYVLLMDPVIGQGKTAIKAHPIPDPPYLLSDCLGLVP